MQYFQIFRQNWEWSDVYNINKYITYILGLESSKTPPPPHFPKIKYERTPKYLVTY